MSRPAVLVFVCLAAFLLLLPTSLKKPGLPMQLYGGEPTQYLMAASLAADGDLACGAEDLDRLFAAFPFASGLRLELSSDDGWRTARFRPPPVYPLLAAPFTALWGARGPVFLNALAFLAAVAAGWAQLRRRNGDGAALLYATGFFVFSAAFAGLFRMEPQVLVMGLVASSLSLGWSGGKGGEAPGAWRLGLSGVALALAVFQQPSAALLALPLGLALGRSPRAAAVWLGGAGTTLAVVALLSLAWTGRAWPASTGDGVEVRTFTVDSPLELPWQSPGPAGPEPGPEPPAGIRGPGALLEDAGFLLWGRRGGILPYFPFLVPLAVLFLTGERRARKWALVAALVAFAALEVALEPVSEAPHEGHAGNPHFTGVYPACLVLLGRLPAAATAASYALGAMVLSTLLLTPFGAVVPEAPVYAHTRSFPLRLLPFEYPSLGRASELREVALHGLGEEAPPARLWAPADQSRMLGDDLWLLGGESVELWLESRGEIRSAVFSLRNLASGNRIALRLGGERQELSFEQLPSAGVARQARFEPRRPTEVRRDRAGPVSYYRLRAATRLGEKPKWRMDTGGRDYLGVGLAFLGTAEFLERDLYAARWLGCGAPPSVGPGETFQAVARLENASPHPWPHQGPARVRLSYRWLRAGGEGGGEPLAEAGLRSELPRTVEPGEELSAWVAVRAPRQAGRYVLELDPLFEHVAWFSDRNGGATCRVEVEVAASETGSGPGAPR